MSAKSSFVRAVVTIQGEGAGATLTIDGQSDSPDTPIERILDVLLAGLIDMAKDVGYTQEQLHQAVTDCWEDTHERLH